MSIEKIARDIESCAHLSFDKKVELQQKHSWAVTDARVTVFAKLNNILNSMNIGYYFIYSNLSKKEWWTQHQNFEITDETIVSSVNEFEMFFRIGLIQNLNYCIESSFGIFVRAIDLEACRGGLADYKILYVWLLTRANLRTQNEDLLDLLRNIRNSMHNNGLFFPVNKQNQTVVYKGVSYTFEVGKPNNFVTTQLIVDLIPDVISLLENLVTTSPLIDINYIEEIS